MWLSFVEAFPIAGIIYLSSGGAICGDAGESTFDEETAVRPVTPYGWGKVRVEALLREHAGRVGRRLTIFRPSNPEGAMQRHATVGFVIAAMNAALSGTELKIWGDGSVARDYFDMDDLSRAIVLAANRTEASLVSRRQFSLSQAIISRSCVAA